LGVGFCASAALLAKSFGHWLETLFRGLHRGYMEGTDERESKKGKAQKGKPFQRKSRDA
jgi:hypothetical protein